MSIDLRDSIHIQVTFGTESCSVHLSGNLDALAVARLAETLRLLPPGAASILLRLSSTEVGPGALVLLRHALQQQRRAMKPGRRLAVWADQPRLRAALPAELLCPPDGQEASHGDGMGTANAIR